MRLGVVVIARNEERGIVNCLRSAREALARAGGGPLVLVDAGSTDQTAELARSVDGVQLLPLTRPPYHAAVARNRGASEMGCVDAVQFLDGDMVMDRDWLVRARAALERTGAAAVDGRLREREIRQNIWNATFGLDWPKDMGQVQRMGGAAAWRMPSFRFLGGFDVSLSLGEDPDLSLRAHAEGLQLVRLPEPMASHDLDLTGPCAWWKRATAVGRSRLAVARRHGSCTGLLFRNALSVGALLLPLALALVHAPLALLLAGLHAARLARFVRRDLSAGVSPGPALVHGLHLLLLPIPTFSGALFALNFDLPARKRMAVSQ